MDRVPNAFLWDDGGIPSSDYFIYFKEYGVLLEEQSPFPSEGPERVNGVIDSSTVSSPFV